MPESAAAYTNGHAEGVGVRECENMETFLFTSESVGEGHPGKREALKLNVHLKYVYCKDYRYFSPPPMY